MESWILSPYPSFLGGGAGMCVTLAENLKYNLLEQILCKQLANQFKFYWDFLGK